MREGKGRRGGGEGEREGGREGEREGGGRTLNCLDWHSL